MDIRVGPAAITIHTDDEVIVCDPDASISSNLEQGYFASDTRFVSGYRLKLGRLHPVLMNSAAVEACSARFEYTNPDLVTTRGPLRRQSLHLRLDRILGKGVHEDYDLTNYSSSPIDVDLEVSIESDFADLFDVKSHQLIRRGLLQSTWDERSQVLTTRYRNGDFTRAIELRVNRNQSATEFANGGLLWRIRLQPAESWHTCLLWAVDTGTGKFGKPGQECHALGGHDSMHLRARRQWVANATRFATDDHEVTAVASQAISDLSSLRIHLHDEEAAAWVKTDKAPSRLPSDTWVPSAGVPWFVSLFGRDALVVSLQTLALAPRFALGALRALAALQADAYDDSRDMQPGKIEHEVRHGELASLHLIPHTPYYGSHDATTLYVWTAAEAWRWHGDRDELNAVRPHVERALAWIDRDGDLDGDGLQEYKTRAKVGGYFNQGWKDSGEAIVHADGSLPSLPIALCELQGYVVAAKRAWASVLKEAYHDGVAASKLQSDADALAERIEKQFYWEEEHTYYLGLDGDKRPIASVGSNPAHLLWAGAVPMERAREVAERLLMDDMWSGWGIRTLSSSHPSYNPFSYQLGSVWPHDNAIAVAGFRRYGLDQQAAKVARAIFDAAQRFLSRRLPELFAGLSRDEGSFPVQYLGANVPQAWAAGAVVHLLSSLLGLRADAPNHTLVVEPALPNWLTELSVENLSVGDAAVDLKVRREADNRHSLEVTKRKGDIEVRLEPDWKERDWMESRERT
ncbi:MAG: amylo-alpha-1,6-glucosidase [Actinobacteria bacterium]|nr:amylo-alpha-1,6-glucosidase [Actinomycetota bacterium]